MAYGYPNFEPQYPMSSRLPAQDNMYVNQYQNQNTYNPYQMMGLGNPTMTQEQSRQMTTQYNNRGQSVLVRAVTGQEEAVAAQIPLDGTLCVFTDTAHKKIYTKQLNMMDGSALFDTYVKVEPKVEQTKNDERNEKSKQFVPIVEFDNFKQEVLAKFEELAKPVEQQDYNQNNKQNNKGGNK